MMLMTRYGGELARQRDVIRAAAKKLARAAGDDSVGKVALGKAVERMASEVSRYQLIEARLDDTTARGV